MKNILFSGVIFTAGFAIALLGFSLVGVHAQSYNYNASPAPAPAPAPVTTPAPAPAAATSPATNHAQSVSNTPSTTPGLPNTGGGYGK